MDIRSFGCSLIFGTDLPDCVNQDTYGLTTWPVSSCMTWPALIAAKIGSRYVCHAHGGSGNLCILNRVLDSIQEGHRGLYIIGWTYIDRFDYSDPKGKHHDHGLNDYLAIRPHCDNDLSRFYYSNLHSEFRDKFTNLIYIRTAIDMLQRSKIPFVMTCLDDLLFDKRWHVSPAILDLMKQIDPYISNFNGMNFLDWSRNQDFPMSDNGHPNADAHAAAANLMLPIIDAILHRA